MDQSKNITYVFSHSTLLSALNDWEDAQIKAYPHQKERIQTTVIAMQHFLQSPQVQEHKMIMSGETNEVDIQFPQSLLKASDER